MKIIKNLAVLALLVSICSGVTSCASIIHGKRQEISVSTNPPGASVSDGTNTWMTPARISLERKKTHLLTFSKAGYHTQTVPINRVISSAVFANILIPGGIIGWGIDAISGAQWRLVPEQIVMDLHPTTLPIPYQSIAMKEKPAEEEKEPAKATEVAK